MAWTKKIYLVPAGIQHRVLQPVVSRKCFLRKKWQDTSNIFLYVFLPGIARHKLAFLTWKSRGKTNWTWENPKFCNQILHLFCPFHIWMFLILSNSIPLTESASHSRSEGCLTMFSIGPKCYLKRIFTWTDNKVANSPPYSLFIMSLYQMDKHSTKFTIWKYW
jgi:hypothetical protein